MDISKLTKEELEALQSQITTQLSAVEREEIKQQTPNLITMWKSEQHAIILDSSNKIVTVPLTVN